MVSESGIHWSRLWPQKRAEPSGDIVPNQLGKTFYQFFYAGETSVHRSHLNQISFALHVSDLLPIRISQIILQLHQNYSD